MKLSDIVFPPPFKARHYKRTFVSSPEDEASRPTREVIDVALAAVRSTVDIDVSDVSRRMKSAPHWPDTWPGEHYRLLAGFVAHLKPRVVIEIGTDTGLSALCMMKHLRPDSRLASFDIAPWNTVADTCLEPADFADGRLTQTIADLGELGTFKQYAALLSQAELFFVDGPKDERFEPAFARHLDTLAFARPPWVIFDDIHDLKVLSFWRTLRKPKLDLTSFGHWTGTGLVQWTKDPPAFA